ncbi:polynucleotide adenylyltransferase PcnB [Bordetella sp. N]|uniref:polynucleotide adenylyltransferase PcnB n=1 Tax=Bordetella sp. N TaxID=1746199 RepID=UPI00070F1DA2|nr:polynucleotide adenylyltransferase PcnB [Bordetella sp. N]ALM84438.1 poly(A) polymerase [Bordetella sp. N]
MITETIRKFVGRLFPARGPLRISADKHGIDRRNVSRHAIKVCEVLRQHGFEAFIVGGAVRDLIVGIEPKDFDIATNATPEEIRPLFRRARIIGRRFQLVHVVFGQEIIETSTFRAPASEDQETDEHGRILRDNVFGSQAEDAARRDFTLNALYYDPLSEEVIDYHNGVADLKKRIVRMIGDPNKRYREDPVRMLRAVRFAAKLNGTIEPATREPIRTMADLIENVPASRLFDEMLKLLTCGHAMDCLRQLRAQGLHHGVLPLLDVVLEQPGGENFVELALERTDARVRAGKSISPSFLFAALLWQQVEVRWRQLSKGGEQSIPALIQAADSVLDEQTEKLAIQRRFSSDMREIWFMQPRFERRVGKTAFRMLEQPRFRAACDFLQLRAAAGEFDSVLAQWWMDLANGDDITRTQMIDEASRAPRGREEETAQRRRRRPRRKPPGAGAQPGGDA